ncbi:MAG: hypothetical protein FJY54_08035 [Betaproteobacteria bacterium]|nr:hypothetical protein [Betaproteobacteria bacterium]
MLDQPFVFLDLETTGAHPAWDRVTEVGLLEVDRGRCAGEWSSLVNPGRSIPPAIQALNGITNEMVALAPAFPEIADELYAHLDGKVLVAHNARFDYGFLRQEFRRAGLRYNARVLCTVKLSRKLYPEEARHNLDALMLRHGLACEARHRALGDARVLWQLVQAWRESRGPDAIESAASALLARPSLPAGLTAEALDEIPEAPGVYLFYGENGVVLYVGKSTNLRTRVMAHFAADHRDAKDMKIVRQVKRVDWIETVGELGALIEEARLVKRLAPVYNRRLRHAAELCAWHWRADWSESAPDSDSRSVEREGAQAADRMASRGRDVPIRGGAPQLVSACELDVSRFGDLYGLYRSRSAALEALCELAGAHGLCPLLLGLDKGRAPCFAHQIRRCRGACIGKETRAAHAARLAQALARLRMRPWPFKGRIGVRVAGEEDGTLIVLDRWCYLGTVRSEQELHELGAPSGPPAFDLDTYRVLTRFFSSARRGYTVLELPV